MIILFTSESINFLVLDIMLPKITGLSVLHEIRKTSTIPVLIMMTIEDEYTPITSFDELGLLNKTFFNGFAG